MSVEQIYALVILNRVKRQKSEVRCNCCNPQYFIDVPINFSIFIHISAILPDLPGQREPIEDSQL